MATVDVSGKWRIVGDSADIPNGGRLFDEEINGPERDFLPRHRRGD